MSLFRNLFPLQNNLFPIYSQAGNNNESQRSGWTSYNIGPAHVITLGPLFAADDHSDAERIRSHYRWLEEDLSAANQPVNRAERPWLITMAPREPEDVFDINKDPLSKWNDHFVSFVIFCTDKGKVSLILFFR
mgnify:CR=1 FL=1